MKLLYLNHNMAERGGTYYRALDIGRHMVRLGHAVTLLTISPRARWGLRRETRDGVTVVHTPDLLWGMGRSGWDPWDTLNRLSFLRGRSWDIVHAWDSRPAVIIPALFARQQSKRASGKLVLDWCDWWGRGGTQSERPGGLGKRLYGPVETFFEERFRGCADASTVISQALYERAVGLGVDASTLRLLPQGCDVEAWQLPDREEARHRLGLRQGAPLVVTTGALLAPEATLLFDALRSLFVQRPDCTFAMIGTHRARIPADLQACPQLVQTGYVNDQILRDYMAACDAMVTPLADRLASRGRWPSKVNPFLAAGRAVVITRVGDLAALLHREQAAMVVECDAVAVAEGILTVLDKAELRGSLELKAHTVASTVLAWPTIVGNLEALYYRVRG